jgi:multidrug efflux pump subunit AcrA (membrane-fusion protein)
MFLIDDLLFSPISGFQFVMRTLARAAEEQYTDDTPIKERLLELQTMLEEGAITEEEYVEQERQVLAELREIQNRRMEMAGISPEEAERMGRPMLEIAIPVEQANEE